MSRQDLLCENPYFPGRRGDLTHYRCWSRRRCSACATLMMWDDQEWLRTGVQHWIEHGVSLVFLTLTLEQPKDYPQVQEMWRQFKQALDRLVSRRPGYPGGLPFARVFERQEQRFERTGETVMHIHSLFGGIQYRGDRLSGRPQRGKHLKAEELGLVGAVVTKEEVQRLALRYGFGPVLDVTQIQARPDDLEASYRVARYLTKYLGKFEHIVQWLPKGRQVVTGSRGKHAWIPGKTRLDIRKERAQAAREYRQSVGPAPKGRARADAGTGEAGAS